MELPGGGTLGRITIIYAVLMACTTLACATKYLSPFQLYFSPSHIRKGQVWRIVSHLFYLSNEFSLEFFLYMLFWIPYSNDLENDSFRNRPADFLFFLLFGSTIVTVSALIFQLHFMAPAMTIMVTYVWARRHPHNLVAWMGLFTFRAPYLPWMILLFSILSGSSVAADLAGIFAGHVYYYLVDVYPRLRPGSPAILQTPGVLKALFPPSDEDLAEMAHAQVLQAAPLAPPEQQQQGQRQGVDADMGPAGGAEGGAGGQQRLPPRADVADDDAAIQMLLQGELRAIGEYVAYEERWRRQEEAREEETESKDLDAGLSRTDEQPSTGSPSEDDSSAAASAAVDASAGADADADDRGHYGNGSARQRRAVVAGGLQET